MMLIIVFIAAVSSITSMSSSSSFIGPPSSSCTSSVSSTNSTSSSSSTPASSSQTWSAFGFNFAVASLPDVSSTSASLSLERVMGTAEPVEMRSECSDGFLFVCSVANSATSLLVVVRSTFFGLSSSSKLISITNSGSSSVE
uniref:Putative cell wall integrity and stress response component 1 n=1 Tax=Anopheles darlingi TaxID=43151 RepID=A0A2M4D264_ANODA